MVNQWCLASYRCILNLPLVCSLYFLPKWSRWATLSKGKPPVSYLTDVPRWLTLNTHFNEGRAWISASFVGNSNLNIGPILVIREAGAQVESKPCMHGTTRWPLPWRICSSRYQDEWQQRLIGMSGSKWYEARHHWFPDFFQLKLNRYIFINLIN